MKYNEDDFVLIYRAYITLRNGRRLYARQKGKKAFAFWVPRKKS